MHEFEFEKKAPEGAASTFDRTTTRYLLFVSATMIHSQTLSVLSSLPLARRRSSSCVTHITL